MLSFAATNAIILVFCSSSLLGQVSPSGRHSRPSQDLPYLLMEKRTVRIETEIPEMGAVSGGLENSSVVYPVCLPHVSGVWKESTLFTLYKRIAVHGCLGK